MYLIKDDCPFQGKGVFVCKLNLFDALIEFYYSHVFTKIVTDLSFVFRRQNKLMILQDSRS